MSIIDFYNNMCNNDKQGNYMNNSMFLSMHELPSYLERIFLTKDEFYKFKESNEDKLNSLLTEVKIISNRVDGVEKNFEEMVKSMCSTARIDSFELKMDEKFASMCSAARMDGFELKMDEKFASMCSAARMDGVEFRVNEKFNSIDKRFDLIDERFEQVEKRFEQVDKRFEQVEKRFDQLFSQIRVFFILFGSITTLVGASSILINLIK